MAITISKPYLILKKETFPEFVRQTLLENLQRNEGNVEKTAREMRGILEESFERSEVYPSFSPFARLLPCPINLL